MQNQTEDCCVCCREECAPLAITRTVVVDHTNAAHKTTTATTTVVIPVCEDCYQLDVDLALVGAVAPRRSLPEPTVLTNRQRAVLLYLASGWSNGAVAKVLGVSIKTIDTHRQHMMARLQLHSNAELTEYALAHNMTLLPYKATKRRLGDLHAV